MPATRPARGASRRALRQRRRALTRRERRAAQTRIAHTITRMAAYCSARRIAVYFAVDGEVELSQLIEHARRHGKSIHVPVLAGNRLRFIELRRHARLARNRYGILEPKRGPSVDLRKLDLVLTPLVAFDAEGTRLGMGKGYYDRSFAFLERRRSWVKPRLVGVGFEFQRVETLAANPWDVRLWAAVTETASYQFVRRPQT
jgi:5-formyltetrahydrofolate cyclo-ligase